MTHSKTVSLIVLTMIIISGVFWISYYFFLSNNNTSIENSNIYSNVNQPNNNTNNQPFEPSQAVEVDFLEGLSSADLAILDQPENYFSLLKYQRSCERLSNQTEKEEYLAGVKLRQVVILNDPELCSLVDLEDDCYLAFALKKNDKKFCHSISNSETKDVCLDYVSSSQAREQNNVSLCGDIIDNQIKESCIHSVIAQQKDLNFCNNSFIVSNDFQEICQSVILMNRAIADNDPSICSRIPLQEYKQNCLSEM